MSRWLANLLLIISAFFCSAFTRHFESASGTNPPPGPDRYAVTIIEYTAYEWWMVSWRENHVVCSVTVDHEGIPTSSEVYRDCGQTIYAEWISQEPCITHLERDSCKGYYAYLFDSRLAEKESVTPLAPATAWISLEGCEPFIRTSTNVCARTPTLVITGQEPLPTETIARVEGIYNEEPFVCEGSGACKILLRETGIEGVPVEFWVYSSYGDSSLSYRAIDYVNDIHQ